jgi:hypothetical protein
VYVFSGGWGDNNGTSSNGINYFGLSNVTSFGQGGCVNCLWSTPGLTVQQAFAIDSKIDDGLPLTGNVMAAYINSNNWYWGSGQGSSNSAAPTSAISGNSTTCFDNGNNSNNVMQYSVEQKGGAEVTCGLVIKFQ